MELLRNTKEKGSKVGKDRHRAAVGAGKEGRFKMCLISLLDSRDAYDLWWTVLVHVIIPVSKCKRGYRILLGHTLWTYGWMGKRVNLCPDLSKGGNFHFRDCSEYVQDTWMNLKIPPPPFFLFCLQRPVIFDTDSNRVLALPARSALTHKHSQSMLDFQSLLSLMDFSSLSNSHLALSCKRVN